MCWNAIVCHTKGFPDVLYVRNTEVVFDIVFDSYVTFRLVMRMAHLFG